MPYASLKEVFPDAPFSGTTGSYLDRLNPDRSRIEPFKNNGDNDNEVENFRDYETRQYNGKGYQLPQYLNPKSYPQIKPNLQMRRNSYVNSNMGDTIGHNRASIIQKSLPNQSPTLNSHYLEGKMGGGYRLLEDKTPTGVIETKNYQDLSNAFNVTDITFNRLANPLRKQLTMSERLPQEYKVMPKEDYYSYITPAMEEQIVTEMDKNSCHNFYKHLKECPTCKRGVAGFFSQSSQKKDFIESFSNYPTANKSKKSKMNRMAELFLVILMGIFIIFVMNVFLQLGIK